jgi:hypothetical protein
MKKRGLELFSILIVLVLLLVSVVYIGTKATGYGSKKTPGSTTSVSPSSATTPTSTSPSSTTTSGSGSGGSSEKKEENKKSESKEKSEIRTSINKESREVRISAVTEEGETKNEIKIRDTSAISDLKLEKEDGSVRAKLSNGEETNLAVFPDTASRIAMSELRSSKQSLKIKESGEGDNKNVVYISEANKTSKVLGLFSVNYKFKAEIDAKEGKVIKSQKPWWTVLGKDEEDDEIEEMGLQLIKPIQDIILYKNTQEKLNLNQYFLNAKSYSFSESENIVLSLKGDKLTLVPNQDYTGTESIIITAYNKNETLDASFNVIVSEGNLSVLTKQYPAIVNEKVRWEKRIKIDRGERARIDLPTNSESVVLTGIDKNNSIITNQTITGNFVDIDSGNNADSYEINYYTPAPGIKEISTEYGKEIIVSNPTDVHYTEVLAFSHLSAEASKVELYRITENGRESVNLNQYDLNGNGLVDYIEWIVPFLSNQTYDLIVEAVNAEHLDSNRIFISNIYNQIKSLDGVWSETIPADDYVRVTFKQPLDNSRDITLYPNVISGTPYIEVYENNGIQLISQSMFLVSNKYNKIPLTNLPEGYSQDTFDLRVVGGSIQIDYIVDPSTVILNSPMNNAYLNNQIVTFNCSATDDLMLSNITLYGNWTGIWNENETKEITGVINSTSFTKTIADGKYIWNCLVYNNQSTFAWFASNYTFTIDTIPPINEITYPLNISYNKSISSLNYTYTEINPNNCWYSVNNGAVNLSVDICGTSFSSVVSSEGSNTWIFYMNDSAGNLNSTRITFVVDTTPPVISFSCDKTSVDVGEKLTCSCSATDSISQNPAVSYTASPSTDNTGNFVTLCSATDNVGNTATSQFLYGVYGSGGLPSYWKRTYLLTSEMLGRGYTSNIGIKERIEMQINNERHYLGVVNLGGNTATINVSSTSQQIILNNGEEKKLELTGDNYYDLLVKLNSILNSKANITIMSIREEVAGTPEETKANITNKMVIPIIVLLATLVLIFFIVKKKLYKKILKLFR